MPDESCWFLGLVQVLWTRRFLESRLLTSTTGDSFAVLRWLRWLGMSGARFHSEVLKSEDSISDCLRPLSQTASSPELLYNLEGRGDNRQGCRCWDGTLLPHTFQSDWLIPLWSQGWRAPTYTCPHSWCPGIKFGSRIYLNQETPLVSVNITLRAYGRKKVSGQKDERTVCKSSSLYHFTPCYLPWTEHKNESEQERCRQSSSKIMWKCPSLYSTTTKYYFHLFSFLSVSQKLLYHNVFSNPTLLICRCPHVLLNSRITHNPILITHPKK